MVLGYTKSVGASPTDYPPDCETPGRSTQRPSDPATQHPALPLWLHMPLDTTPHRRAVSVELTQRFAQPGATVAVIRPLGWKLVSPAIPELGVLSSVGCFGLCEDLIGDLALGPVRTRRRGVAAGGRLLRLSAASHKYGLRNAEASASAGIA